MNEFIQAWAQAIATFEGFYQSGTVAQRNNNPGNLKFAGQSGASGKDSSGFAIFPDVGTGWQALYNQLASYVSQFPNYTILQIMARYLGQSVPTVDTQGNAFTYASNVANALGVTTDTTLATLASGEISVSSNVTVTPSSDAVDGAGADTISIDTSTPDLFLATAGLAAALYAVFRIL